MVATLSTLWLNRSWLVVVPSSPVVLPSCPSLWLTPRMPNLDSPIERKETGLE